MSTTAGSTSAAKVDRSRAAVEAPVEACGDQDAGGTHCGEIAAGMPRDEDDDTASDGTAIRPTPRATAAARATNRITGRSGPRVGAGGPGTAKPVAGYSPRSISFTDVPPLHDIPTVLLH